MRESTYFQALRIMNDLDAGIGLLRTLSPVLEAMGDNDEVDEIYRKTVAQYAATLETGIQHLDMVHNDVDCLREELREVDHA